MDSRAGAWGAVCEVMWKHREAWTRLAVGSWKQGSLLTWCFSAQSKCPVPESSLAFPTGMPMSDQYVKLEEERRHKQKLEKDKKKKKQKKEKRGKHHRHNSLHTESEEDIAPAHHVDIITEEMPEVSSCAWGLGFICVQLLRDFCPPTAASL